MDIFVKQKIKTIQEFIVDLYGLRLKNGEYNAEAERMFGEKSFENWCSSLGGYSEEYIKGAINLYHQTKNNKTAPRIRQIKETEKEFEIEIAAPGMTKEDFAVCINNDNELVIALEKKSDKECKEGKNDKECRCGKVNYLRKEFSYTSYHQSFTLPENIDLDAVKAEMVNGVLDITLPKRVEQEKVPATRRIEIK